MSRGRRERPSRRARGSRWALLAGVWAVALLAALAFWLNRSPAGPTLASQAPTQAGVLSPEPGEETAPASPAESSEEPTAEPSAEPTVEPTAEPSPAPAAHAGAEALLAEMTLREKVCQMMMANPTMLTGVSKVSAAGETTRKALEKYPVGAIDYNTSNMQTKEQVRQMLQNTQSYSKIPLLMTCDEEGGRVTRLMHTVGTTQVNAMYSYKDQGPEVARENAVTLASDLVSCGFNMDLAPVADVWTNPANTVIGDRAYSDDYAQAAQLIPAAVEGFHAKGVVCVLKHFPGHGSTSGDSHYGSAYVNKTLDQLRQEDLIPFQAGIDAGADMVMMGHLIVEDIDPEPAVFSYKIVTELLREEMGFQGVVITDALEMRAITDHYGKNEVAVKAVKAGVDMLLCPLDLDGAINAILNAVESGEITEARIDESVLRILRVKEARGLL